MNIDFGAKFKKFRKEKGMTYKVLAEKAGLCIDTVQIACKGCRVSLESADKMAKVLQCAVDKAFKLEVRKSPYSSTTINGVHRFLRAVCHYAEKHKLLTDNPPFVRRKLTRKSMCFPRKKALVSFAPSCARRIFASKRRC